MSEERNNDEMEIDLSDLIKSVFSRIWITILSFVICVAISVVYLLFTTPIYEASSSMMVEPLTDTTISNLFEAGFSSSSDISTELEILNSRTTYETALSKLDLSNYRNKDGIRYSDFEEPLSYEALIDKVTVEPVTDTSYLRITVSDSSPEFACDFCNALSESYSEVLTGITRNSARNQLDFISSEIPNVEERLRQATAALADFQRENSLLQLSEENQILLHQMSYLTMVQEPLKHEVEEAERYLSNFEASHDGLREIRDTFGSDATVIAASDDIITWYSESVLYDILSSTSNSQISVLSATQQSRYYALTQMMESAETELENYLSNKVASILSSRDALTYAQYYLQLALGERRISVIEGMLADINVSLEKVPEIQRRQMELESDVEVYQQLVLYLRQSESQTALLEASITDNVTRIDSAILPLEPVSPSTARTLLIGGFLGIFVGIAISVVLGLMDKRIMTRDDLAKAVKDGIPILGWVPLLKDDKSKTKKRGIALSLDPMSFISERYKHIASAIIYGKKLGSHYITVCSPGKNDGKTTTLANIAYALALNGKRILIVDMDLRMPALENVFQVKHAEKGIVDVLNGDVKAEEAIRTPFEELPNLNILGVGRNVLVPSIVIQTQNIEDFISSVRANYDYIFFDAPPLSYASELLTISRVAPEVLIVTRSGISTTDEVKFLLDSLEEGGANIIGVCLNGLALQATSLADKSSYGYGYGLSSSSKKERENIRKNYVNKKSQCRKIYKQQLKKREKRRSDPSWPLAPLSFDVNKKNKTETKSEKVQTKERLKSFDDYLSVIESDENAKGKKE